MFTSFELKNRPFCRCFYKIPAFVKNMFLLACLAVILFVNYLVVYQGSDFSVKNVKKWIAGLNSKTFDYLSHHAESLFLKKEIKSLNVQRITTVDFYSSCVSPSRPCMLHGLAKTWPAFTLWTYKNGGMKYLSQLLGD